MPTLSSALDPAGYPHPKLEGAIRDFARRQPWLDAELAAWFFFEVVRRLPPDLPGEHLTFGRHERSRPGINILLGNYLLAVSLTFRTIDAAACPRFPAGTHFVWHLANAVLLGWMIRALVLHGGGRLARRDGAG